MKVRPATCLFMAACLAAVTAVPLCAAPPASSSGREPAPVTATLTFISGNEMRTQDIRCTLVAFDSESVPRTAGHVWRITMDTGIQAKLSTANLSAIRVTIPDDLSEFDGVAGIRVEAVTRDGGVFSGDPSPRWSRHQRWRIWALLPDELSSTLTQLFPPGADYDATNVFEIDSPLMEEIRTLLVDPSEFAKDNYSTRPYLQVKEGEFWLDVPIAQVRSIGFPVADN